MGKRFTLEFLHSPDGCFIALPRLRFKEKKLAYARHIVQKVLKSRISMIQMYPHGD
jgi:hypothetical protein